MALGIYWWDFGNQKPLSMDLMKSQCETALQLLKQGHIEAPGFLRKLAMRSRFGDRRVGAQMEIQDVGRERFQRP